MKTGDAVVRSEVQRARQGAAGRRRAAPPDRAPARGRRAHALERQRGPLPADPPVVGRRSACRRSRARSGGRRPSTGVVAIVDTLADLLEASLPAAELSSATAARSAQSEQPALATRRVRRRRRLTLELANLAPRGRRVGPARRRLEVAACTRRSPGAGWPSSR